jgi:hypothetical protein
MTRHRFLPLLLIAACLSQPALAQIDPFRGTRGTPLSEGESASSSPDFIT